MDPGCTASENGLLQRWGDQGQRVRHAQPLLDPRGLETAHAPASMGTTRPRGTAGHFCSPRCGTRALPSPRDVPRWFVPPQMGEGGRTRERPGRLPISQSPDASPLPTTIAPPLHGAADLPWRNKYLVLELSRPPSGRRLWAARSAARGRRCGVIDPETGFPLRA